MNNNYYKKYIKYKRKYLKLQSGGGTANIGIDNATLLRARWEELDKIKNMTSTNPILIINNIQKELNYIKNIAEYYNFPISDNIQWIYDNISQIKDTHIYEEVNKQLKFAQPHLNTIPDKPTADTIAAKVTSIRKSIDTLKTLP